MKKSAFIKKLLSPATSLLKVLSPQLFVKLEYRYVTGHKLNLKNPKRYTEKLQRLRLFDYPKNELVKLCTDRIEVRKYLKEKGLENYLVPTLGEFNNADEIDFSKLPNQFVIKCTHSSGFNIIVKDKNLLNVDQTKKQLKKYLRTNYGKKTVEHHYKNIKPRIIIEAYLGDYPLEYKIHVFNGIAKYLYVVSDRGGNIRYNNYFIDWKPFNEAQFNGWKTGNEILKPDNFDEMIRVAETLAKSLPFVRVDLYNINGKIFFGEMTFTPAKGTLKFDSDNADYIIGDWLKI